MTRSKLTLALAASALGLVGCREQPTNAASGPNAGAVSPSLHAGATMLPTVEPAMPQVLSVAGDAPATGQTYRPADAAALHAALAAAVPGDEILLAPGVEYVGGASGFRMPAKAEQTGGFVTIRTDLDASAMPRPGVRVTPEFAARAGFAKLRSYGRNAPALSANAGARGYRIVAVDIGVLDSVKTLGSLVRLGDGTADVVSNIPSDMVLDRVYIHGNDNLNLTRCIYLNSARSAVLNSTVHDCHAKGFDSYAIGIIASPGPLVIENNSLTGAGMGIFSGGGDPRIQNLSPSDIVIRRNHVWRPMSWQGVWTIKNLLELKHAKRVLVEENLFENNWADAQSGMAILFKSTNQSGSCTWCQTADVTFRNNVVRNSPQGLTLAAHPEKHPVIPAARFKFEGNLFYEIGEFAGTTGGRMRVMSGPLSDVQFHRNTFLHNGVATHAAVMEVSKTEGGGTNFVSRDNLATLGSYGMWTSGAGTGESAIAGMWGTTWEYTRNVVVGTPNANGPYPDGTTVLRSLDVAAMTAPVSASIETGTVVTGTPVGGVASTVGADLTQLSAMAVRAVAGTDGVASTPDPTPDPTPVPPTTEAPGWLVNASGGCLSTSATTTTKSTWLSVPTCAEESTKQSWTAPTVGGTSAIVLDGGLCLDAMAGKAGSVAYVSACSGSAGQQWTRTGETELRSSTGLCLTAVTRSYGKRAELALCDASAEQHWTR